MDAETVAFLFFLVTIAVLAVYAAWHWWMRRRRHHQLDPDASGEMSPTRSYYLSLFLERIRMIHIVTTILMLASLWIILSNRYDEDVQKWAFGAMGSVLGFWLRPSD
jgi:hypothetical protein